MVNVCPLPVDSDINPSVDASVAVEGNSLIAGLEVNEDDHHYNKQYKNNNNNDNKNGSMSRWDVLKLDA